MDTLHIGIFGEMTLDDPSHIAPIIAEHIDEWKRRQSFEVRPSHIEIISVGETKGVANEAIQFAKERGYAYFKVPLQEQRYKTSALWMRNAAIIEKINRLLIIRKPKKPQEYLLRLETRAREKGIPIITAFLNADDSLSSWAR